MDASHRKLVEQLRRLAQARGLTLTHLPDRAGVSRSHFWDVVAGRKSPTLQWLAQVAEPLSVSVGELLGAAEQTPAAHLRVPLYGLRAAAGVPLPGEAAEPVGYVELSKRRRGLDDLFAAYVRGKSMEPLIPDGALCLFRKTAGDVQGRVVLVQQRDLRDVETGGSYTVKRLHRVKGKRPRLELRSENPDFKPLVFDRKAAESLRVVAELLEVLPQGSG